MRSDEDLMVYVAARWPSLVRSLVRVGAAPGDAHELAAEALSRCRREWGAESRGGDVDALVRGELAAVWHRHGGAGEPEPGWSDWSEETDDLVVLPPPSLADLRGRERQQRIRTTRRAAIALVPLLLVVSGYTWWTTRDQPQPPPELEKVEVAQAVNPAGVVWYADDVLHLQQVVLRVPGVRSLVAVRGGAVYADAEDRVIHVAETGERTQLGETLPDGGVAGDPATGLVAWLGPAGDKGPTLAAWSARSEEPVGGQPEVADAVRVIAVSGQTVFFADGVGTRAWQPSTRQTPGLVVEPAHLLAAAASTRVYQVADGVIRVDRPFAGVAFEVAGEGAAVSPDGSLVLSRRTGGGRFLLYDTGTGERVANGLDERYELATAALLGPGRVTYVVGRRDPETAPGFVRTGPSGSLELRTCDLATHRCETLARFPATAVPPLLSA